MKINLINGDSLKVIKKMIENKERVDCVISDPPFGKINGMILTGQTKKVDWDVELEWKLLFENLFKITDTIIMFGQNPTYSEMILASPYFIDDITWVKNNSAQGFHADKMHLQYTEYIAVFSKKDIKVPNKIIHCAKDKGGYHPTQKPVKLMKDLLTDFVKPTSLVFDPFMGSGSTGVACKEFGCDFLGVELLEEYYNVSEGRIYD